METWGAGSCDNEPASEWFYAMDEADDPGAVMAQALDQALGAAGPTKPPWTRDQRRAHG